jgi:hypothetical protein
LISKFLCSDGNLAAKALNISGPNIVLYKIGKGKQTRFPHLTLGIARDHSSPLTTATIKYFINFISMKIFPSNGKFPENILISL